MIPRTRFSNVMRLVDAKSPMHFASWPVVVDPEKGQLHQRLPRQSRRPPLQ
jgi:hypothetical protein